MKRLSIFISCVMFLTIVCYGQKIYSVDHEYQADVKVFVVDAEYKADLVVYRTDK